jgi:hypothetical protein
VFAETKQIVIDKSAFVAIRLDALCKFAQEHLLILPDVLCYECHTDFSVEPRRTLRDCEQLIQHGAYYCSCSTGFLQSEGSSLEPYPWFLPDMKVTQLIRNGVSGVGVVDATRIFEDRSGVARKMFVEAIARICKRTESELQGSSKEILAQETEERFGRFLNHIDTEKDQMRDFVLRSMPKEWVKEPERFCLSDKWVSWHYFRLVRTVALEYCCCGLSGGAPAKRRAEHDYQDLEYVLLLSRADGLLTKDKKLAGLAKAAFPKRNVFSSLEEIPEDYVCHWNQ